MALVPQTQRDKIMAGVCVLALGLVYAYQSYLWAPKNEQLNTMEAHIDTLKKSNEQVRAEVASGAVARLKAEAEEYGRLLGLMRQLVPAVNEVPTLLDQISTAARSTGLELSDVTPLGVIPGDIFETHRYRIGVTGSYNAIGRFLNNIGSMTRIVAPMNLALSPSGKAQKVAPNSQLLAASFEIQTYVAKTAPPSAAGTAGSRGQ
jgi:Tfp pilus assembly protein PilO